MYRNSVHYIGTNGSSEGTPFVRASVMPHFFSSIHVISGFFCMHYLTSISQREVGSRISNWNAHFNCNVTGHLPSVSVLLNFSRIPSLRYLQGRLTDISRDWSNAAVFAGTTTSVMLCFSSRASASLLFCPLKVFHTVKVFLPV